VICFALDLAVALAGALLPGRVLATSKALSAVVVGGGWLLRPGARVAVEAFAAQHAAALGDLQTASGGVPDVIGNFWSVGVALVLRP
jgi:hypothetical protein